MAQWLLVLGNTQDFFDARVSSDPASEKFHAEFQQSQLHAFTHRLGWPGETILLLQVLSWTWGWCGECSHRHYCPPSTHPIIDSPNERWLTRFHFHQILALDLSPTEEVPACVLSIIHSTAVQDMRKWMRNIGILACQEWIPEHSWDPPKPNHFLQYKNEHRERERKKGVQRHNLPWHSLDQQ